MGKFYFYDFVIVPFVRSFIIRYESTNFNENFNYVITEHRGIISPSIVEHSSMVSVAQDEGAVLLCIAMGCPSPEYR